MKTDQVQGSSRYRSRCIFREINDALFGFDSSASVRSLHQRKISGAENMVQAGNSKIGLLEGWKDFQCSQAC